MEKFQIDLKNSKSRLVYSDDHPEMVPLYDKINELEEQAKLDQMQIDDSSAEIDRLNDLVEDRDNLITMWMSKYEEAEEERKKAEHERDVYKELLSSFSGTRIFTSRQIAIIAYALCSKGGIIPKNKKNIAPLFHDMTGISTNTISQNLCSSYNDKEIEEVAESIDKNMPEFAEYLREKKFYCPEITK